MEQTQTETRTYQIGGRTFTAPPVVARQEKWLWPIIKPLFVKGETITADDIFTIMGDSITKIAAIVLVGDGQTQTQKVRAGWSAVEQLESWLDETVSVSELGPVIADFFASGQQWKMLTGLAGPLRSQTTGSTRPSGSLPMATSSAPTGSGHTSDSASVSENLSEPGSDKLLSAPSLVSAV